MKGTFPVNKFRELETPFYYYDVNKARNLVMHQQRSRQIQ